MLSEVLVGVALGGAYTHVKYEVVAERVDAKAYC